MSSWLFNTAPAASCHGRIMSLFITHVHVRLFELSRTTSVALQHHSFACLATRPIPWCQIHCCWMKLCLPLGIQASLRALHPNLGVLLFTFRLIPAAAQHRQYRVFTTVLCRHRARAKPKLVENGWGWGYKLSGFIAEPLPGQVHLCLCPDSRGH